MSKYRPKDTPVVRNENDGIVERKLKTDTKTTVQQRSLKDYLELKSRRGGKYALIKGFEAKMLKSGYALDTIKAVSEWDTKYDEFCAYSN